MYLYIVLLFTKAWLNDCRIPSLPCVVLQSKPPTNSFLQMKHTEVLGCYTTDALSYLTQKLATLRSSGGTEASKIHYKAHSSLEFTILCDNYLLFHEDSHKTEAPLLYATSMNRDCELITGTHFILSCKEKTKISKKAYVPPNTLYPGIWERSVALKNHCNSQKEKKTT